MIQPCDLDSFMLALSIWREARGEPFEGKKLVAETIWNRSHDSRWPDTLRDVILQNKQFSAFSAGDLNATLFPKNDPAWAECCEAANEVIEHGSTTAVNHYHALSVYPPWASKLTEVATVGNHVFYSD